MTDRIEFTPTPADMAAAARDIRPRNWGRFERLRLVLAGICLTLLVFFLLAGYVWRWWEVYILRWEDIAAFAFAGGAMGWLYGGRLGQVAPNDPRLSPRSFALVKDGFETRGK